jgi:hypothetical protein
VHLDIVHHFHQFVFLVIVPSSYWIPVFWSVGHRTRTILLYGFFRSMRLNNCEMLWFRGNSVFWGVWERMIDYRDQVSMRMLRTAMDHWKNKCFYPRMIPHIFSNKQSAEALATGTESLHDTNHMACDFEPGEAVIGEKFGRTSLLASHVLRIWVCWSIIYDGEMTRHSHFRPKTLSIPDSMERLLGQLIDTCAHLLRGEPTSIPEWVSVIWYNSGRLDTNLFMGDLKSGRFALSCVLGMPRKSRSVTFYDPETEGPLNLIDLMFFVAGWRSDQNADAFLPTGKREHCYFS